jgi:hypothetical protein
MAIELYTWDTPNGRKISVALEEMGLPYTVHPVNISKNEQFAPDFLRISPNNKIPAIIDPDGPGGQPISVFESGAILIYLGQKTGKFYPSDPRKQVPVLEWLMWQMGGFGPMPGQVHHFLQVETRWTSGMGWSGIPRKPPDCTVSWTAGWRTMTTWPTTCRSPTLPSWAGHGGMSGTRPIWRISRTCSGGTRR